jgi:hypothetical protein
MAEQPEEFASDPKDRVTQAREFFEARRWGQLWLLKKKAKYGWDKLGFTNKEAERIKLNKPDWV